jgi:hypothetical protein
MRGMFLFLILILGFAFAEQPAPFGLNLGKTTEEEFLSVVKSKGWTVGKSGYRIIKGDITNPDVTGYLISGIDIERLDEAYFWFYKGKLFQIEYRLAENMNKETFYLYYDQLKAKYSNPVAFTKPWLADGRALWRFGEVEVELFVPWVSRITYLTYTHRTLYKQSEKSDEVYYRNYIKKKGGSTEGL